MEHKNNKNEGQVDAPKSTQILTSSNSVVTEEAGPSNPTSEDTNVLQGMEKMTLVNKRLSGAGRKRMAHFLREGLSPEDARKKAEKPLEAAAKRVKASHTANTPPTGNPRLPIIKARTRPTDGPKGKPQEKVKKADPAKQNTFRDMLVGTKIGILHSQHPNEMLTTKQLEAVQTDILRKIKEKPEGVHPQFLGSSFKPGWMILTCENEQTTSWLKNIVGEIKPDGNDIIAVEEDQIPRPEILIAYLPGSQDEVNSEILGLIENQNPGVNTSDWRVLHRSQAGNITQLTLSVDQKSVEVIKAANFKVSYKFGKITLRKKGGEPKPTPPAHAEGSGEGTSN